MDKYIGFDVDSKKTVACVIQKGERDRYTTFRTDMGQMKSFLQQQRQPGDKLNLTFEVSGQSRLHVRFIAQLSRQYYRYRRCLGLVNE